MTEGFENHPLRTEEDITILMHREAHFGGSFSLMIDYYEKKGKGSNPKISLKRVKELSLLEEKLEKNLAPLLLTGAEAEKVGKARTLYKNLRSIYSNPSPEGKIPRLIADLILSEQKNPKEEINAIVTQKGAIVAALIFLLQLEDFYDPLFPGYGEAPTQAAICLGKIKDEKATKPLFESMTKGELKHEEAVINALKKIGKPAKKFLLKTVQSLPISSDNEKAAIALLSFLNEEVSKICLKLLQDETFLQHLTLASYLIFCCEKLSNQKDRKRFAALANNPKIPKQLLEDIQTIEKSWKST